MGFAQKCIPHLWNRDNTRESHPVRSEIQEIKSSMSGFYFIVAKWHPIDILFYSLLRVEEPKQVAKVFGCFERKNDEKEKNLFVFGLTAYLDGDFEINLHFIFCNLVELWKFVRSARSIHQAPLNQYAGASCTPF